MPNAKGYLKADPKQGRREFAAIVGAAVLIQILIGAVASLRGDAIAWGSLLQRPLLLTALAISAIATRRLGYVLLTSWFSFLALMYVYGGFAASYTTLMSLRWIAGLFFGWAALRLATSAHIRAYCLSRPLNGRPDKGD